MWYYFDYVVIVLLCLEVWDVWLCVIEMVGNVLFMYGVG